MELNKENFDAIIIGSGIGGLVTASQLAAKGAQVLVLEKYIIPGGSGGSFKRKGYTFDVGASMIFGFGKEGYTNLLTRALKDVNEKCETIPDPVQLEYHLPNNFNISVDKNYEDFINKLSASFPKEKKSIKKFYDTCASVFKCLDSMPLLSIEDPSYLFKVFFKSPLSCLGLARWLPVNAGDVARRFIKDPELLRFIDIECFCWSVMPALKTPMINAGMVFTDRHAGGINYPKGGVGTIAEKLVSGIEKLGGEIRYKAYVNEILLKDKKSITIGQPYVNEAKIELEVVSHKRDKKILVYKMRPKKKTRRKMGHRQELTRVMVRSISIGKGAPKSSSKKEETVKKETKPKSEKSTN